MSSECASCLSRSMAFRVSGAGHPVQASNLEKSRSSSGPFRSLARSPSTLYTLFLTASKVSTCMACKLSQTSLEPPQLMGHLVKQYVQ